MFLINSLTEIETDETILIKFMDQWFKIFYDHTTDMTDAMATNIVNCFVKKGRGIKSIFQRRKRMVEREDDNVKYIPGVGRVKISS